MMLSESGLLFWATL